jgi:hypothetical protein
MNRRTLFFFEVYLCDPETREDGWDIQVGTIRNVKNRDEAVAKLQRRFGRELGSIIQCYELAGYASSVCKPLHLDGSI